MTPRAEAGSGRTRGSDAGRLPSRLGTALALLAVDAGLRVLGFARMDALLGGDRAEPGLSTEADAEADAVRALGRTLAGRIERAACLRVYRVPCLPRALLLRRWLLARGLPAALRIGARREGPRFRAHAWVELAGATLDPDPRVGERFPPLQG